MPDQTTNNKIKIKINKEQVVDLATTANSSITNSSNQPVPKKDGPGESSTLRDFRDTIKDVLEEITSLQVNTMIVGNIPMTKFDPQEFYTDLLETTMYRTEEGLRDIKKTLLERSTDLKQKGALLPQTELDRHNRDLEIYNRDLEIYKQAERAFSDRQNSLDPQQKKQFEIEKICYKEIFEKVLQLDVPKNPDGSVKIDAKITRLFRKLWELEQSVLNGERIYAQTKLSLDGDLTNRFIDDLFVPNRSKIDPTMAKLVFDLHNHAAENAQKQWSGLITTCVNLVKDLMPFRSK